MKWALLLLALAGCQSPDDDLTVARSALYSAAGWSHVADAGATYRMQDEVDGGAVGLHIQTNAVASTARLAEITRDQVDLRASGNAQNGPGVVGIAIGNRGTAQNPIWVDTGTATMEGLGGWSKIMPIVLSTPYVYFNGQGTTNPSGYYASVVLPHTGMGSDGAVTLPWVATLYTDGAPDINPNLSVDTSLPGGGSYAVYVGGDFCDLGDGIVWGQGRNGNSGYEDVGAGSSAPISSAGHIRRAFDETPGQMGFTVNVDADAHWMPLPVAMQYFTNYDPASQTFPVGETTVHTVLPGDTGHKGLRSWDPHRWTLPAALTSCGGQLRAGIRFYVNTGSSQILSNTTGADVSTARDSVFLALVGAWITEVRLVVTNTAAMSCAGDLGNFQYEGTVY